MCTNEQRNLKDTKLQKCDVVSRPSTAITDHNCQWVDKFIHVDKLFTIHALAAQLYFG